MKNIPQEEPKQETLEEAAREYWKRGQFGLEKAADTERAFLRGGLWQAERMYSEEEVKEIIKLSCEEGMLIQRTINDKVKIPYMRIKDLQLECLNNLKRNKMEKEIFKNKYIWMFKEHHKISCECSYCKNWFSGQNKMHYGLNIPLDWKAANSWYTIKYGKGKYLRWVNSWIRLFKNK